MATKSTIEALVEEQTIQSEVASQECKETNIATAEEKSEEAESVVGEIAKLDKEGVLARLAEKVAERPSAELRHRPTRRKFVSRSCTISTAQNVMRLPPYPIRRRRITTRQSWLLLRS